MDRDYPTRQAGQCFLPSMTSTHCSASLLKKEASNANKWTWSQLLPARQKSNGRDGRNKGARNRMTFVSAAHDEFHLFFPHTVYEHPGRYHQSASAHSHVASRCVPPPAQDPRRCTAFQRCSLFSAAGFMLRRRDAPLPRPSQAAHPCRCWAVSVRRTTATSGV